jgi:hypothetical protein
MQTYDRTQGVIEIVSRWPIDDHGTYKPLATCTPEKLLRFIDRPLTGPIDGNTIEDYLVEAFDRGFCTEFDGGEEGALFGWKMPDGKVFIQHST